MRSLRQPKPARAPRRAGQGQVRIIGGRWRRRLIRFPDLPGLRPTPDRVRETLFNWLGQDLTGRRCLDLFAGSGALAFEALSRNAQEVVMVESHAAARAALAAAAAELDAGARARIGAADALQFLTGRDGLYDVVFLDPPFGMGWPERVWPAVAQATAPQGVVYIEAERPFVTPPGWRLRRSGRAGTVHFQLLEREEPQDERNQGDGGVSGNLRSPDARP